MANTRIMALAVFFGLASCQPALAPDEPCGEMWGDFIILECEEI